MRKSFLQPILVCALALGSAACGGGTTNESAPAGEGGTADSAQAAADPCSFISKEEVTAVTGETVLEARADGQACYYETDDDASELTVEVKQGSGAEDLDIAKRASGVLGEIGRDLKGQGGAKGDAGAMMAEKAAAPKIGDEAFFGANSQLHVRKGDAYFAVQPPIMRSRMSSSGSPLLSAEQRREMAAGVAQKIAAKL
jgi:hypothetical protein